MSEHLIIGGGVYGAAVAWELARRGEVCRLLEAKHLGAGASAGPGRRGTRANGRDPREIPLVIDALRRWPDLHEDLGVAPLFERTGQLLLIERDQDLLAAEARAAMQTAMGIPSRLLTGAELRDYEPDVGDDVVAALYCPEDGVSDHSATTKAYAAAARKQGAAIVEGAAVRRMIRNGGRIAAVETDAGERIDVGGQVLLLANAGVRDLASDFVQLPVWHEALQVLLSVPLDEPVPVRHLIGHAHRPLALKAEDGNRIMISGGHRGRWDAALREGETLPDAVAANVADAVSVYPGLAGLQVETADAGHLETLSPDGIPIIDRLPDTDNALLATAWCGHGWAIAPTVAALLAEWALTDQQPKALAPFGLNRFEI